MDNLLPMLNEIFQVCIVPLLGIVAAYLIKFLKEKAAEVIANTDNAYLSKYLGMLTETVETCVIATNQTYVDALKDKDAFDEAAQKEAFQKTYDAVMAILSEEAKTYLTEATGDLEKYIKELIEKQVNIQTII